MNWMLIFCRKTVSFWKVWNARYQKSVDKPCSVSNKSDPIDIADEFRSHYSSIYVNSSDDKVSLNEYVNLASAHQTNVCKMPSTEVDQIERCIKSLKLHKACGIDGIMSEHLLYPFPPVNICTYQIII